MKISKRCLSNGKKMEIEMDIYGDCHKLSLKREDTEEEQTIQMSKKDWRQFLKSALTALED